MVSVSCNSNTTGVTCETGTAIARDKNFTKIMLPMLKLYTNYGFHELFLNYMIRLLHYSANQIPCNMESSLGTLS